MQKLCEPDGDKSLPSHLGADPSAVRETGVGGDAHDRIFFAAERLFAEGGYEGVSVREIVQEAGVNLAAVSYHFGSKHALLMAVFVKRARELDGHRLELLRAAERENGGAPSVEALMRAYIAPPILWRSPDSGKATAIRFLNRTRAAPTRELRLFLETRIKGLTIFRQALARAAPQASSSEICWTLHFAVTLSYHGSDLDLNRLTAFSQGACDVDDIEGIVDRAVRFAAAGLKALCGRGRASTTEET